MSHASVSSRDFLCPSLYRVVPEGGLENDNPRGAAPRGLYAPQAPHTLALVLLPNKCLKVSQLPWRTLAWGHLLGSSPFLPCPGGDRRPVRLLSVLCNIKCFANHLTNDAEAPNLFASFRIVLSGRYLIFLLFYHIKPPYFRIIDPEQLGIASNRLIARFRRKLLAESQVVPFVNARTPRGLKLRRSIGLTLQCNPYFQTAIHTYSLVLAFLHIAFSLSREIHLIALDIDFQRAKFQDRILFSLLPPSRTSQSLRFASRDRHLDDMRRKIFQKVAREFSVRPP